MGSIQAAYTKTGGKSGEGTLSGGTPVSGLTPRRVGSPGQAPLAAALRLYVLVYVFLAPRGTNIIPGSLDPWTLAPSAL